MSLFSRWRSRSANRSGGAQPTGNPNSRRDESVPIAEAPDRVQVTIAGRIRVIRIQPQAGVPTVEARIADESGELSVLFLGRRHIAGVDVGRRIVATGVIHHANDGARMLNPVYELV